MTFRCIYPAIPKDIKHPMITPNKTGLGRDMVSDEILNPPSIIPTQTNPVLDPVPSTPAIIHTEKRNRRRDDMLREESIKYNPIDKNPATAFDSPIVPIGRIM